MKDNSLSTKEAGRRGGLARARKHSSKEIAAWGRKGGRPRKQKVQK